MWRIQKEENCFWRFALRRIKTGALLREFNNIGECSDFDPSFSERRGPYYLYYQIKIVQGGVANSKSPLCAHEYIPNGNVTGKMVAQPRRLTTENLKCHGLLDINEITSE